MKAEPHVAIRGRVADTRAMGSQRAYATVRAGVPVQPRSPGLFGSSRKDRSGTAPTLRKQLLKWVGNKQRFAYEIIARFPSEFGAYYEPFLGSGAVLGTLAPRRAVGSDICEPLVGIWRMVQDAPEDLAASYEERWEEYQRDPGGAYGRTRANFNRDRRPEDLFFLSRSCYAGIIRFRRDGYLSTGIGPHTPVPPHEVRERILIWRERTVGAEFVACDFETTMARAGRGDLVYCDPPYSDSQAILYGAQDFTLERLYDAIRRAKSRGAHIALSIDGRKKTGGRRIELAVPDGLFESEVSVNCGRSMLRRLQMSGRTLEGEEVTDRLLLTWPRGGPMTG